MQLAQRWQLTVYDATYLELALRESLPPASMDTALCQAARGAGVEVMSQEGDSG
jgi:predicted nucleic acid-binding protein